VLQLGYLVKCVEPESGFEDSGGVARCTKTELGFEDSGDVTNVELA